MNQADTTPQRHPWKCWSWIPSLYFIEGLPYVAVNTLSVVLYTNMDVPIPKMAFFTSLLNLPWVFKFLWSPFVDILRTKRWWIVTMQWLMAVLLCLGAISIPTPFYFWATLAVFFLTAFASATHDIAADGFYMLALDSRRQSFFVGIRSTFYRFAIVFGQGLMVTLAGVLSQAQNSISQAWMQVFLIVAALIGIAALWHSYILPRPADDHGSQGRSSSDIWRDIALTFKTFFVKKGVAMAIIFMLLYRLPEALLLKLIYPFLMSSPHSGGLGMSNESVGIAYGVVGVIGLLLGGIIGGIWASRVGLKKCIRPMAWAMSLTCLTFVVLSQVSTPQWWLIYGCIFIEQLGYGFGFSAYMLYLLYFSQGKYATSHYAFCTAFMAASIMLPGLVAGLIEEILGFANYFILCMVCCIATITVAYLVKIDSEFGKK